MSEQEKDWGNVRFRPRNLWTRSDSDGDIDARFTTAIIVFIVVALLYPWYEYWVQSRLMARDFVRGAEAVTQQLQAETAKMDDQLRAGTERRRAQLRQQRINRVRILGATQGSGSPMVIVDLGDAGLTESASAICRQAEAWLGRPLDGVVLRVQRGQAGKGPISVGKVRC